MTKLSQEHFNSLHVWCEQMADALNAAGYDFKRFLEVSEYKTDVPFTKELVKDQLWRQAQIPMTGKQSTTEITPFEAIKIYDVLNKRIAELTGVSVEWPHDKER